MGNATLVASARAPTASANAILADTAARTTRLRDIASSSWSIAPGTSALQDTSGSRAAQLADLLLAFRKAPERSGLEGPCIVQIPPAVAILRSLCRPDPVIPIPGKCPLSPRPGNAGKGTKFLVL